MSKSWSFGEFRSFPSTQHNIFLTHKEKFQCFCYEQDKCGDAWVRILYPSSSPPKFAILSQSFLPTETFAKSVQLVRNKKQQTWERNSKIPFSCKISSFLYTAINLWDDSKNLYIWDTKSKLLALEFIVQRWHFLYASVFKGWLQSYCQDWGSNLYHQDYSEILFVNQVLLKHPSLWTSPPLVSYCPAPTISKACLGMNVTDTDIHWSNLMKVIGLQVSEKAIKEELRVWT